MCMPYLLYLLMFLLNITAVYRIFEGFYPASTRFNEILNTYRSSNRIYNVGIQVQRLHSNTFSKKGSVLKIEIYISFY